MSNQAAKLKNSPLLTIYYMFIPPYLSLFLCPSLCPPLSPHFMLMGEHRRTEQKWTFSHRLSSIKLNSASKSYLSQAPLQKKVLRASRKNYFCSKRLGRVKSPKMSAQHFFDISTVHKNDSFEWVTYMYNARPFFVSVCVAEGPWPHLDNLSLKAFLFLGTIAFSSKSNWRKLKWY